MTDPITDMLNRIRNAQAVFHETVAIPFSKFKYEIAKLLEREEYIDKVELKNKKNKKVIDIKLKYDTIANSKGTNIKIPSISGLKRISKPGQKIYVSTNEIKLVYRGYGMAIISTPKGLMTAKEARKKNFGGEFICKIW